MIITQSIPGLEMVYDRAERLSLMAAAGVQAYLTPQDELTAEVLSKALGQETITSSSKSTPLFRMAFSRDGNLSERSEERALISEGQLKRMPDEDVMIIPRSQYPIKAKRVLHYQDKRFVRLFKRGRGKALPYPPLYPVAIEAPVIRAGVTGAIEAKPVGAIEAVSRMEDVKGEFEGLEVKALQTSQPSPGKPQNE